MSNNTNQPVIDVALLRKVLDHIEAHKDEWDQSTWRAWEPLEECGTVMCFAGHACHIMGGEWVHPGSGFLHANEADDQEDLSTAPDNSRTWIHAAARARRLLGLTLEQANQLFEGDNSLEDLHSLVDRFEREAFA